MVSGVVDESSVVETRDDRSAIDPGDEVREVTTTDLRQACEWASGFDQQVVVVGECRQIRFVPAEVSNDQQRTDQVFERNRSL